jgi:uncharacterized protein YhaN
VKITDLQVDGYGVWTALKVAGFADGLNVLYGPNEAGKTTLLHFVRSMLYGFSPLRRRYFPPVHGGRPGGGLAVAGPNGRFEINRHDQPGEPGTGEQLVLTAADGTRQGEYLMKVLLCNVDEAIFNNVFAVGLREMQELGTLSDTEAAALLYNLTAGLDRVSLVEVMRELETSRNRILDRDGKPCQVVQLLADREKLRAEIEELAAQSRRYGHLAAEHHQSQQEVARLEEECNRAEYLARVIELAINLREPWKQRTNLDDQLAALGPPQAVPAGAVERLDALNARLQSHRQQVEQLQGQWEQARAEAAGLTINEALWRQAARVEALREQEPWLTTLQNQIGQLETEIAEIESRLAGEQERLGLGGAGEAGELPTLSVRALAKLRAPARALRAGRVRLEEARQSVATAEENAQSLERQIAAGLAARGQEDLTSAMERAGNLVSQLRRRVQSDERLEQMTRYQAELEQQSRDLLERQLLPPRVLAGLGAVFVLGVLLVLVGLFRPGSITGSLGWSLALLGLAGSGAAAFGKIMLERSNARQLENCQKQIHMLQSQIQQTTQERDALDRQLPRGGPIAARLETAEKELAALEELVPLDTRCTAARQEAEAATRRVAQAQEELGSARRRWREALAAVGLPGTLAPKQVRQLVQRCDQIGQMQRRLAHRREEVQQRRRERDSLSGRIAQLATDTGVGVDSPQPIEQLRQLGQALARQEAASARREVLRRQARQIRLRRSRHEEAISRLQHRRRSLLLESGAKDEQELRRRAVQAASAEMLRKDRAALDKEITVAIGGHCPEEAVREQLQGQNAEGIEQRRTQLLDRVAHIREELKQRYEKRGQLAEQLKTLSGDRRLAIKQLELATIEKRLEDALGRWQVLASTSRILDIVRTTYEKDRQPETLQEASGYLDRLTQGRYRRVWTPLGEHVLRLDDAEGRSLGVEALSRGTREQLFLSLRLALAASYARRGASLPLVLDDVLVNFDADRAKAAAALLRDFAGAGHQLLIFTCHEHILRLFTALKVPVSRLPDNSQENLPAVVFQQSAANQPQRTRKSAPAPRKVAAQAKVPELEEDISPKRKAKRAVFDADFFDPDEDVADEEDEQDGEEDEDIDEEEDVEEYEEDLYEDDGTAEAA